MGIESTLSPFLIGWTIIPLIAGCALLAIGTHRQSGWLRLIGCVAVTLPIVVLAVFFLRG